MYHEHATCSRDIHIYVYIYTHIYIHVHVYHRYIHISHTFIYLQCNYYMRKTKQELTRATHTISESCWNVGRVQLAILKYPPGNDRMGPTKRERSENHRLKSDFWWDMLVFEEGSSEILRMVQDDWSQIDECERSQNGTCCRWCWNLKVP